MSNPISRRRALATGGLAAGLAALLTDSTGSAASDLTDRPLVSALCRASTTVDDAAFTKWLAEWRQEREEVMARHELAFQRILGALGNDDEARGLADNLDVALGDLDWLETRWTFEQMFRHMPGMAPVMRLLYDHIHEITLGQEETCGNASCFTLA